MRDRTSWLLVVAAGAATLGLVVSGVTGHHGVRREAEPEEALRLGPSPAQHARAVLRAWDDRRAAAWARADVRGLQGLYTSGSATGRRDRAMLAAYRHRGLRVSGMTRQVSRLDVVHAGRRRLTVVVTDRLVDARVVGRHVASALPDGRPVARRLRLVRVAGTWRVAEVVDAHPAR